MAMTQDLTDLTSVGPVAGYDSTAALYYMEFMGVRWFVGDGTPTHTTLKGSMAIDKENAQIYMAADAAGTWTAVKSLS